MKKNKPKSSTLVRSMFAIIVFSLILPVVVRSETRKTVTDMIGRQVAIPEKVDKIVTTFKPVTLCVLSLGFQDRIIGIDTHSKRDKLTLAVFPKVATLTGVGSKSAGLNFETIVSLKPDLVILYAQKDGKYLADRLEVMGIASLVILPESFGSIKKSLDIIALAMGQPEKAKKAQEAMDIILEKVEEKIRNVSPEKRKKGYFASPRGLFSTAAGNMLQDDIMSRAGLFNVAHELKGYFQDVSPEQFIAWDPQIVVLSRNLGPQTINRLKDPALQRVHAIRAKQIYRFPSNLVSWDFPSPLSALGTLWLAHKAYPGLFADEDLEKESDWFHQKIFGRTFQELGGSLNDTIYKEQSD